MQLKDFTLILFYLLSIKINKVTTASIIEKMLNEEHIIFPQNWKTYWEFWSKDYSRYVYWWKIYMPVHGRQGRPRENR